MSDKTIKLYDEKPYASNFEGEIVDIVVEKGKTALILNQTLFFPEEGGQTPDKGVISIISQGREVESNLKVIDVQIRDDIIYHYISEECEAHIGDFVAGSIDFEYRFSNMQNHSGEHIFSGLAKKYFDCTNVGFHLSDSEVTFDYDKPLSDEEIEFLEKEVNKVIYEDHKIWAYYPSDDELLNLDYRSKKEIEGAVRLVEIEDVDLCACCAPHVRRTGEIGILKVVDYINYKGGIRISILCGSRALEHYKTLDYITKEISHTLSSATSELADNVKRINDSLKDAEYKLIAANKRYLDVVYDQVTEYVDGRKNGEDKPASMSSHIITDNAIILNLDGVDNKSLRDMVNNLKSRYKDCLVGVISKNDKGYFFILGSDSIDCRNVATGLREALNAKGGGSAEMIQGNVAEKIGEEDITKILEDVL